MKSEQGVFKKYLNYLSVLDKDDLIKEIDRLNNKAGLYGIGKYRFADEHFSISAKPDASPVDVNTKSKTGKTLLDFAVSVGNSHLVQKLKNCGAKEGDNQVRMIPSPQEISKIEKAQPLYQTKEEQKPRSPDEKSTLELIVSLALLMKNTAELIEKVTPDFEKTFSPQDRYQIQSAKNVSKSVLNKFLARVRE